MNKEEYRKHIEDKYSGSGYSYVSQEDKDLEMQVHDLLVDIMTSEASANRLIAMFPSNYGLPKHCLGENELEKLESFESVTIHSDILDDGEFHIIYDGYMDAWFFNMAYDFMDCLEDICKIIGIKIADAEIGSISGWRRTTYSLGLDDFAVILECVKSGDFTGLRDKISLVNAKEKLEKWRAS